MPEIPDSLRRCVGDAERFLAESWNRRYHLHRGSDTHDDLLSLGHVDEIVATMSLRYPAFRLVRAGQSLPQSAYTRSGTIGGRRVTDLIDVGRVHAEFADGATIVLQGLHRYWSPVTEFCRDLEGFLTHPVQANAYITPPVSSGLNVHHDTHDVFALQTHGRKQWVIHDPVVESPLASQRWSSAEHDPGEPVLDTVLEPGDCLYVPRGTPHAARTVDVASAHLTIGVRQYTWHDVLEAAFAEAADDVSFRESLPAGFAHDPSGFVATVSARLKEMAAWLEENADADAVARRTVDGFWQTRVPHLVGGLREILSLAEIGDATRVERRPGTDARISTEPDGQIVLDLGDRELVMPAAAEPALRRIFEVERLRVGDLADLVDDESRRILVRRLVREGFLVTVGE
jgi:bifunctional lysine-specific demethylase and histidyl-hydroxylase NO66